MSTIKVLCSQCNNEFEKPLKHYNYAIKHNQNHFCSQKCVAEAKKRSFRCYCANCNKEIIKMFSELEGSKSKNLFCNRKCATSFNNKVYKTGINHPNYKSGIGTYRKKVVIDKCNRCGYSKELRILQVHHKDRNRKNNIIENLEVLCPNCHQEEHLISKDGLFTYHED